MSTSFLKLPRELRDRVYELCLLHQEPLDPWIKYNWTNYNQRQELTIGLLRANKIVHREASLLFYAQNHFDFSIATPQEVASFLGTIGCNNSDFIQHICINFPNLRDLEPGNVALEESSRSTLANIHSRCTSLSTLSLYGTNAMLLKLDALDYPKIITEALRLVDTRFRAISTLQEVIVEIYEDGPSGYIRREMESHGWTISVTFGAFEDDWSYDYGYGYSDYDNDVAYDVDNSDFWRRAGD
jgi:hypothetical protein